MLNNTFFKQNLYFIFSLTILLSCSGATNDKVEVTEKESKDSETQIYEKSTVLELDIGDFEQSLIDQGLVNIQKIDSSLMVDLKYSSKDNFFQEDVYQDLENAYLPPEVAQMLIMANKRLQEVYPKYRLLIFDAVRPHNVQRILWMALDSLPVNVRKAYVADPEKGSLHNYGCAVDLSIYDTQKDSLLDMGTTYDYFGYLAYPRKETEMLEKRLLSEGHIANREVLRSVMKGAGFRSIRSEWWHFNSTTLAFAKLNYPLIQ
ncbi:MAG: D-alanyl-D-alanine dipeptidase [Psychromonas sp.]|jgi:D-alanyl-D-alanine dipeptidase